MTQIINSSGLFIEFSTPMIICDCNYSDADMWSLDDFTENHRVFLNISGESWVLAEMRLEGDNSHIILAKEEAVGILNRNERLKAEGLEIEFVDFWYNNEAHYMEIRSNSKPEIESIPVGEIVEYENKKIKVWNRSLCVLSAWAEISVFEELVVVSDSDKDISLTWKPSPWDPSIPSLESVFVSESSPIFEKLTR